MVVEEIMIGLFQPVVAGSILIPDGLILLANVSRLLVVLVLIGFLAFLLLVVVLNRFFDLYTGGKKRPVFFDIQKTYPALLALERNYPVIREELEAILPQKNAMPKYHELDVLQYHISAGGGENKDWKVFMLYAMGRKPESNRALCPRTCALLDQIPNLFEAFFSILDGGKSIPAHPGPYRGYLRYHLGLKVPEKNPPTIRVKDQYYTWKEGESILFDDSWEHEVYNHSDDVRVVLIVDVLRPLPPLPHAINRLAQPVIGFFYARGILGLSEMVQKLSHFLRRRFKPRRSPNSGAA